MPARDKYTSLLQAFVSYGRRMFITLEPDCSSVGPHVRGNRNSGCLFKQAVQPQVLAYLKDRVAHISLFFSEREVTPTRERA
jgi:hypothetical protein